MTPAFADNTVYKAENSKVEPEKKEKKGLKGKWLPVPIFLTEPAIGYGLGMSLGYIHPHKAHGDKEALAGVQTPESISDMGTGRKEPPTITGIAAGYTGKDTWFAGIGHSASWRKDTLRYKGGVLYGDIKSTYYILDSPLDFNLLTLAVFQDLKVRIKNSNFFLGGSLLYMNAESTFDFSLGGDREISLGGIKTQDVGIALDASFDRRDNTFTPNNGQLIKLDLWRHDQALGSDFDYWKGSLKALSFHQFFNDFILGLRLEGSAVDGRPPFWAHPWITLRGIPAMRYQGEQVAMFELEGRWNFLERWAAIAFAGTGQVFGKADDFITRDNIYTGGIGGRYLFLPEENLWLGADLAKGPESIYFYITVGQAW